jgi:hypothetical protein
MTGDIQPLKSEENNSDAGLPEEPPAFKFLGVTFKKASPWTGIYW